MGHFFSDKVETAIRYIYYDLGAQRGQEGFRLLQEHAARATPTLTACWRAVCTDRNTPGWDMIFR